jgi:hypothetical protein
MLGADMPAEERVVGVGEVARGVDVDGGGAQVLVGDDAGVEAVLAPRPGQCCVELRAR